MDEDRGAAAFTLTQNYDQVAINDDQNPCVEAFGPALVNGVLHMTVNDNGEHLPKPRPVRSTASTDWDVIWSATTPSL
ncbi:MAG: hypothetical protein WB239_16235 [Acidimicrobiia bacterium]